MIPFEFYLDGPPVSQQARSKRHLREWQRRVAEAAQAAWPTGQSPVTENVTFEVTYFFVTESPDVDNIIKPIQDALRGVVYVDDAQVTHTSSRKTPIDGRFRVLGVPVELAVRLAIGRDFLRVRVLPPPDHENLQ